MTMLTGEANWLSCANYDYNKYCKEKMTGSNINRV